MPIKDVFQQARSQQLICFEKLGEGNRQDRNEEAKLHMQN